MSELVSLLLTSKPSIDVTRRAEHLIISTMLMDEEDGPLSDITASRSKSPHISSTNRRSHSPFLRMGRSNSNSGSCFDDLERSQRQDQPPKVGFVEPSEVKLPSVFSNSFAQGGGGSPHSPINRASPTFRRMDGSAAMKRQGSSTVFLPPPLSGLSPNNGNMSFVRDPSTNLSTSNRRSPSAGHLPNAPCVLPPLSSIGGGGNTTNSTYLRAVDEDALEMSNLSNSGRKYLDASNGLGCTALHAACDKGHFDVIPLLIASGADPNLLDSTGHTALQLLLRDLRHSKMKVTAAAEAIIGHTSNGEDPEDVTTPMYNLATSRPSMLMTQSAATAAAKGRFRPNVRKTGNYTALHYACEGAFFDIVPMLLNSGATPNVGDRNGTTPLALLLEHPPCAQIASLSQAMIVTKGFDSNAANAGGRSLLHLACCYKHCAIVGLLIRSGANPNLADPSEKGVRNTPLHWLLAAPIVLTNSATNRYPKSLSVAASAIIRAGHQGRRGVIFDTSLRNAAGKTVLHLACDFGHIDAALLLLEVGADPSATDNDGLTPLHVACPNSFQLLKPLLSVGADPGTLDYFSRSALDILRDRFRTISTIGGQTSSLPSPSASPSSPVGARAMPKGRPPQHPLLLTFVAPMSTDSAEGEQLMSLFDAAFDALLAEGGVRHARLGYGPRRR